MATPAATPYFPPRAQREVLEEVLVSFPLPLAVTYARLQDELDRQEPVAAVWHLRDAFECLLRFVACLALADYLRDTPDPEVERKVMETLFKSGGLTLGDWHRLLTLALRPLARAPVSARRLLPGLYPLFFTVSGRSRPTPLGLRVNGHAREPDGAPGNWIGWRNEVIGHGVFQHRAFYAGQVEVWLPRLHDLYRALAPVLASWRLVSSPEASREVSWQGAGAEATPRSHIHQPGPAILPVDLVGQDGRRRLPLAPLLSVQRCSTCGQPALFFFDRTDPRQRAELGLLEYELGHAHTARDWDEARRLAERLPAGFTWQRSTYDPDALAATVQALVQHFSDSYLRPDYLLDRLWQFTESTPKGYVLLTGPAGAGKSYLARGLAERDGPERGIAVLAYHIVPGAALDYRTFMMEVVARAREQARLRTEEPQLLGSTSTENMQQEFVAFLATVMQANDLSTLLLVIDGLDELPEPLPPAVALTAWLPAARALPAGCFVVLTTRERVRPAVAADLQRLQQAGALLTSLTIDPAAGANQQMLRTYLEQHLRAAGYPASPAGAPSQVEDRREAVVATILARSGGIFLYAAHLVRALTAGVFPDSGALPTAAQFYPAYLARLEEQVGAMLYERCYLRLLVLLAAAAEPVSTVQLRRWGLPDEQLLVALLTVRDFLRVERGQLPFETLAEDTGESRYGLAHEAFARYLAEDDRQRVQLREAHATIGQAAYYRHAGRWTEVEATSSEDLYDLQYVAMHLAAGGSADLAPALARDLDYAESCVAIAATAYDRQRYPLSAVLHSAAIAVYRPLVEAGRTDLLSDLARVLMNRANTLYSLGRLAEALAGYDEAPSIRQRLVEAGRSELLPDLARVLMNRAVTLDSLGRLAEALAGYDEATRHYRTLVEAGRADLLPDLATVLMNRAVTLRQLGRLEEALAGYDEATRHYRPLVEAGRTDLLPDLAMVLMNRAGTLDSLGRLAEALAGYDEATQHYRSLVEAGRSDLLPDLATVLMNRAGTLYRLGRLAEALAGYDEATQHYRTLVEAGRSDLLPDLARVLMNRAGTLYRLGRLDEALAGYDEATRHYRTLVEAGRSELLPDLATVLMNRAGTLASLGRLAEALAGYDEATQHYRSLVEAGRSELLPDLASVLMNRAGTLASLGRLAEALAGYDEATQHYRSLVEAGRSELLPDLASVLMNRAGTLASLGRLAEALAGYDEATQHYRSLVEAGRSELLPDLASVLMNRALTLASLGRLAEALAGYDEATRHYRSLVAAGRSELLPDLATVLSNRAQALATAGRQTEALRDCEQAVAIRTALVAQGQPDTRWRLLTTLGIQVAAALALGHRQVAADAMVTACRHILAEQRSGIPLQERDLEAWRDLLDTVVAGGVADDDDFYSRLGEWGDEVRRQVNERRAGR